MLSRLSVSYSCNLCVVGDLWVTHLSLDILSVNKFLLSFCHVSLIFWTWNNTKHYTKDFTYVYQMSYTFTFKVSQFFIVSYYSEYVHIYFFSRNPKLKKPGTIIGM